MRTIEKFAVYNAATHKIWDNKLFDTKREAINHFARCTNLEAIGYTFDVIRSTTDWDCKKMLINVKA
jgi:hypothetical protein